MQAVILAAGLGTRMGEFTKHTPKSLIKVAGKTLLEHKFDALPKEIDEIILVIGYLGEMIQKKFGDSYKGRNVTYVDCPDPVGGTMYALARAKGVLHGKFLATNGDDIHAGKDVEKILTEPGWALAVMQLDELGSASRVEVDEHGVISDIVEADTHGGGAGLAGVGLYVLDQRVFDVEEVEVKGRKETGLPQTMLSAAKKLHISLKPVSVSFVAHISRPEDVQKAEALLVSGV